MLICGGPQHQQPSTIELGTFETPAYSLNLAHFKFHLFGALKKAQRLSICRTWGERVNHQTRAKYIVQMAYWRWHIIALHESRREITSKSNLKTKWESLLRCHGTYCTFLITMTNHLKDRDKRCRHMSQVLCLPFLVPVLTLSYSLRSSYIQLLPGPRQ